MPFFQIEASQAVSKGNLIALKHYLSEGALLDYMPENGETLLNVAVKHSQYEIVDYLLTQKFNLNQPNQKGDNAIFFAIRHSTPRMQEKLIKAGIKIHHTNHEKNTPLHIASQSSFESTALLLQYGAQPNVKNKAAQSPLFKAVDEKRYDIMELLIKNQADPWFILGSDKKYYTVIDLIVENNDFDTMDFLIAQGLDVNHQFRGVRTGQKIRDLAINGTPLWQAIYEKNEAWAEYWVMHGADLNVPHYNTWKTLQDLATRDAKDGIAYPDFPYLQALAKTYPLKSQLEETLSVKENRTVRKAKI